MNKWGRNKWGRINGVGVNGVGVKFTIGLHDFKSMSRSTPQLLLTAARVVTSFT